MTDVHLAFIANSRSEEEPSEGSGVGDCIYIYCVYVKLCEHLLCVLEFARVFLRASACVCANMRAACDLCSDGRGFRGSVQ